MKTETNKTSRIFIQFFLIKEVAELIFAKITINHFLYGLKSRGNGVKMTMFVCGCCRKPRIDKENI